MSAPKLFEGDYSHAALVERAMRNAHPHGAGKSPRWVAVREVFGSGSGMSVELCRACGLDPHEMLDGCSDCQAREDEAREQQEMRDGMLRG